MATLYIVRGLPGSGKSTLASKLVPKHRHREADMRLMFDNVYAFSTENAKSAHTWCLKEIKELMAGETADCCVSNTFMQRWEYQPYIDAAKAENFDIQIIECDGPWKSIHDVPTETLLNMAERWQPHI